MLNSNIFPFKHSDNPYSKLSFNIFYKYLIFQHYGQIFFRDASLINIQTFYFDLFYFAVFNLSNQYYC